MKVFTNKYPILGMLTMGAGNTIDADKITVDFEEGKVFKVLGFNFDDVVLQCDKKTIAVKVSLFALGFTETELDI